METEAASTAWLIVVAGGAAALGGALIIGGVAFLTRDKRKDTAADRATERMYDDAEARRSSDI